MEADYITRVEHDEYARRVDEMDARQNKRLDKLESSVTEINRLATSIEKIAVNQDYMISEQKKQSDLLAKAQNKIDEIEKAPLEQMKAAKKKTVETIVTVVVTALVVGVLMLVVQNI